MSRPKPKVGKQKRGKPLTWDCPCCQNRKEIKTRVTRLRQRISETDADEILKALKLTRGPDYERMQPSPRE